MADDFNMVPHNEDERFDAVTVRSIERWKESELSGDEWRFSYVAEFWKNGVVVATLGGMSVQDALIRAAGQFQTVSLDDDSRNFMATDNDICCQPGCPNSWTVLMRPKKRYTKQGQELARGYRDSDRRGFCDKHKRRGDCGLDDNDDNYEIVGTR